MKLEADINGTSIPIEIDTDMGAFTLPSGSGLYGFEPMTDGRFLLRVGERLLRIDGVRSTGSSVEFSINGQFVSASVHDEHALMLRSVGYKSATDHVQGQLKAPMPGKIVAVTVAVDDLVDHGQPVVILEAMKMENELKAPIGGRVSIVSAVVGSSVEKNELLIGIEPIG